MCPLDALPATDQTQGSAWFLPFLSSLFFRLLPSLFWCSLCCSMVPTSPGRATPIAMWPESKAGRKSLCPGSEFQAISAVLLPCPGQAESWPLASSFYFILLKIFFISLFIYLWLHWVFVAACGLYSSWSDWELLFDSVRGLLIAVSSLCCGTQALGAWASVVVACGLGSCGSRALEHRLSSCGARA